MTPARSANASVAPPWQFTLMSLTALGVAAILWMVISSALVRRDDSRRHQAVRSELLRLDQAQSAAYAKNGRYATALPATDDGAGLGFVPAPQLQLDFESFSTEAWRAVARDTALTTAPGACGIFRGPPEASPNRAVVQPGVVSCW